MIKLLNIRNSRGSYYYFDSKMVSLSAVLRLTVMGASKMQQKDFMHQFHKDNSPFISIEIASFHKSYRRPSVRNAARFLVRELHCSVPNGNSALMPRESSNY